MTSDQKALVTATVRTPKEHDMAQTTHFYPAPFIRKQVQNLAALGVPRESIHFEEFGPATLSV